MKGLLVILLLFVLATIFASQAEAESVESVEESGTEKRWFPYHWFNWIYPSYWRRHGHGRPYYYRWNITAIPANVTQVTQPINTDTPIASETTSIPVTETTSNPSSSTASGSPSTGGDDSTVIIGKREDTAPRNLGYRDMCPPCPCPVTYASVIGGRP